MYQKQKIHKFYCFTYCFRVFCKLHIMHAHNTTQTEFKELLTQQAFFRYYLLLWFEKSFEGLKIKMNQLVSHDTEQTTKYIVISTYWANQPKFEILMENFVKLSF